MVPDTERVRRELGLIQRNSTWAQIAGVDAGAGQAIGGYQRGATEARQEVGANRMVYASQVEAAGLIRSAGLEAARLRQAAAVIAAVGREISREVGQGMRIRF